MSLDILCLDTRLNQWPAVKSALPLYRIKCPAVMGCSGVVVEAWVIRVHPCCLSLASRMIVEMLHPWPLFNIVSPWFLSVLFSFYFHLFPAGVLFRLSSRYLSKADMLSALHNQQKWILQAYTWIYLVPSMLSGDVVSEWWARFTIPIYEVQNPCQTAGI